MKEVPNIISNSDLKYIEKMMDYNFILNKKTYAFLNMCEDKEIRELLVRVKKMHVNHYTELLNILQ